MALVMTGLIGGVYLLGAWELWQFRAATASLATALRDTAPEAVTKAMNALGRLAEPDEIAAVAAFLLSPDASYITGSTIDVAGGWM